MAGTVGSEEEARAWEARAKGTGGCSGAEVAAEVDPREETVEPA